MGVSLDTQILYYDTLRSLSIYIKKKVCLRVCLFVMYLDTVRANAMKFCREYPFVQRKINGIGTMNGEGWVKFHPGYDIYCNFDGLLRNFGQFSTT